MATLGGGDGAGSETVDASASLEAGGGGAGHFSSAPGGMSSSEQANLLFALQILNDAIGATSEGGGSAPFEIQRETVTLQGGDGETSPPPPGLCLGLDQLVIGGRSAGTVDIPSSGGADGYEVIIIGGRGNVDVGGNTSDIMIADFEGDLVADHQITPHKGPGTGIAIAANARADRFPTGGNGSDMFACGAGSGADYGGMGADSLSGGADRIMDYEAGDVIVLRGTALADARSPARSASPPAVRSSPCRTARPSRWPGSPTSTCPASP